VLTFISGKRGFELIKANGSKPAAWGTDAERGEKYQNFPLTRDVTYTDY